MGSIFRGRACMRTRLLHTILVDLFLTDIPSWPQQSSPTTARWTSRCRISMSIRILHTFMPSLPAAPKLNRYKCCTCSLWVVPKLCAPIFSSGNSCSGDTESPLWNPYGFSGFLGMCCIALCPSNCSNLKLISPYHSILWALSFEYYRMKICVFSNSCFEAFHIKIVQF